MIQRVIYAAAVLLILQIGLAVSLHRSSSGLDNATPDTAFLSFNPEQISSVVISAKDGKELVLNKTDKGWILPKAFSAPANSAQVKELLDKLANARQGLAVATSKEAAKRFKAADDDFERHIVLRQGEAVAADLYLGTSAGFRHSHARVAGKDEVVSIPVSDFEAAADSDKWLDKSVTGLNRDELKAVALGDISLTKKDKDWLLEGAAKEKSKSEEIGKLLDKVSSISAESVLDPQKVEPLFAGNPAVQFTVSKTDDIKVTYVFAKQDDAYVLKMSTSELYFKIGSWQVEGLSGLKRESLLVSKAAEKKAVAEEEVKPEEVPVVPAAGQGDSPQEQAAVAEQNAVSEEPDQEAEQTEDAGGE